MERDRLHTATSAAATKVDVRGVMFLPLAELREARRSSH
jgi:hypothetical protein